MRAEAPLLDAADVTAVVGRVRARIGGLGPIEPLLADPAVSDVLVNGPGPGLGRAGTARLERTDVRLIAPAIDLLVERVVGAAGAAGRPGDARRRRPPARRFAGARGAAAAGGRRARGDHPPVRGDGRAARRVLRLRGVRPAGRRHGRGTQHRGVGRHGGGQDHVAQRPLPAAAARPSGWSRSRTRPSCGCPATTSCGSRPGPPTADGLAAVGVRDLVRAALRMRPDRIVVGEVRGAEALDMVQAMNTGHGGCLSTCHANGPADALRRVETMALHGRRRRAAGGRPQPDGRRRRPGRARRAGRRGPAPGGDGGRGGRRARSAAREVGVRPLADGDRVVATCMRPPRRGAGVGGGVAP